MSNEGSEFTYFIAEKGGLVVASLVGTFAANSIKTFEKLQDELASNAGITRLILNFRDLSNFPLDALPTLVKLQRELRTKSILFRICGLKPELKQKLLTAGVLRTAEITDNLQTALQSMALNQKKNARRF